MITVTHFLYFCYNLNVSNEQIIPPFNQVSSYYRVGV